MLRIGLTGGIGSGKSTIARMFEVLGVPVYYADKASKKLYNTDKELMAALKQHFGEDIYIDGEINKTRLAEIVFNDEKKLALLNSLVHPPTIRDAEKWMSKQNSPYVVKEAALLFESGSVASLDYVIGVKAPVALRIKRVMDRDGVTRDEVMRRINRQIDEEIKMKLCDFIIQNNEQQLVIPQVLALHQKLASLSAQVLAAG